MYPLQPAIEKVNTALRSRSADFFKMNLSRSSGRLTQDHNPLRRTLTDSHNAPLWETNENMCFALWQLMARS
jgi:hypothetical protein